MKTNRRSFLQMAGALGGVALVLNDQSIELVAQSSRALGSRTADDVASDESFWRDVQSAFSLETTTSTKNDGFRYLPTGFRALPQRTPEVRRAGQELW